MENLESLIDISNLTGSDHSTTLTTNKSYGGFSTTSSAVSREIEQLRAEIRYLGTWELIECSC